MKKDLLFPSLGTISIDGSFMFSELKPTCPWSPLGCSHAGTVAIDCGMNR